jgi:lipid II isoglutaminyl synthase (glutamine-hydrolysing)
LKLVICHLYPGSMNIYGDRGNVIALAQRARWRGIDVEIRELNAGEWGDFADVGVFFFGGGQDKEQVAVSEDLQGDTGKRLLDAIESGAALLAVCGGYQLLGEYFKTGTGETLAGVSLFDAYTIAGDRRFIGDTVVESEPSAWAGAADQLSGPRTLVGFENHSGKTYLRSGCTPLGKMVVGFGNNGEDGVEGAVYRGAIGSYLHGSLLPKNPWLTDHLIRVGLSRSERDVALGSLDDDAEERAHQAVIERIRQRGRLQSAIKK